jgi:hypothetical protein
MENGTLLIAVQIDQKIYVITRTAVSLNKARKGSSLIFFTEGLKFLYKAAYPGDSP